MNNYFCTGVLTQHRMKALSASSICAGSNTRNATESSSTLSDTLDFALTSVTSAANVVKECSSGDTNKSATVPKRFLKYRFSFDANAKRTGCVIVVLSGDVTFSRHGLSFFASGLLSFFGDFKPDS